MTAWTTSERLRWLEEADERCKRLEAEIRTLEVLRELDQMYILELRRRLGLVPHDGGPARPGIGDID